MNEFKINTLPIAIIGGGPVGLAAAAQLVKKGEKFVVFEAGSTIGANMLEWGHVKMFSPWEYNVDKAAKELLENAGWTSPNKDLLPTGRELVEEYLLPLSNLPEINDDILLNAEVMGVTRKGIDKLKSANRDNVPFQLYVEVNGESKVFEVKAVIDSSGTWKNPNPALSNGFWTKAERSLKERIYYGIPNVNALENRYKNKNVLVVGSGHSAINVLLEIAELKEKYADTSITWILRKNNLHEVYGGQENDALQARGELGILLQRLVKSEQLKIVTPYYINGISEENGKISVKGDLNGEEVTIHGIDEVIVSTGFRPDTTLLSELRIKMDPAVESVEALAILIDPNIHSCGTVRPHGEKELRHPEKNFYIVGIKSYGRAPTFLLATGYEQVRSVVAYLTGDYEGAKEVHLELPETGVCKTNFTNNVSSCCGGPLPVTLEVKNSSCCG